jgi:hypothetical protein
MLQEALKLIQDTATKADDLKIVNIPGDPRNVILEHAGGYVIHPVPPPLVNHVVYSIDDLAAFYGNCPEGSPQPTIWHTFGRIVMLTDESDRRERVSCPLVYSPAWVLLANLAKPDARWMSQKDFVRMLQIDFGVDRAIVSAFRTIDFQRRQGDQGNVQHGRESLGRQVEAVVQGTSQLPEELMIGCAIYTTLGETAPHHVRSAVEIDATSGAFRLTPIPGELEAVMHAHQASIHQRLEKSCDGASVYYGEP